MTDTPVTPAGGGAPDGDVKQRFREALARKQAKTKAGVSHAESRSSTAQPHGAASQKRDFRRKSG